MMRATGILATVGALPLGGALVFAVVVALLLGPSQLGPEAALCYVSALQAMTVLFIGVEAITGIVRMTADRAGRATLRPDDRTLPYASLASGLAPASFSRMRADLPER